MASTAALEVIKQLKALQDGIKEHNLLNASGHIFLKPPYVHQLDSIEVILHCDVCALLIDLGLGKTYIILNYLSIINKTKVVRALILCPKIMRANWVYEGREYAPELSSMIYSGTKKQRQRLQDSIISSEIPNLLITNYEAIGKVNSNDFNFFKDLGFTHLIVDEASRLKGYDTQRSIAVKALSINIKNKYLLSGGLTLGNPLDLWMPYNILDSNILGNNYWAFRNKYCKFSQYNRHIVTGYKNLDMLKNKITPFSIILNKDDILTLPDRTFVKRWIPLTKLQKDLYKQIAEEDSIVVNGKEIPTSLSIIKLNKLLQVISGFINFPLPRDNVKCSNCEYLKQCVLEDRQPWNKTECFYYDPAIKKPKVETYNFFNDVEFQPKLAMLREDITDIEERKEHCIVWCYYHFDFNEIKEALTNDGTTFITSDTPGADKIFEKGKHTVFLGRIADGIGITMNIATTMIYYSHALNLEYRLQSLDRNYRIGQKRKTVVIDYVSKDTIEEPVLELLRQKKNVRDFVHSRVDCRNCKKFVWCMERMVEPYTKHCILYGIRKEAEEVKHITVK